MHRVKGIEVVIAAGDTRLVGGDGNPGARLAMPGGCLIAAGKGG